MKLSLVILFHKNVFLLLICTVTLSQTLKTSSVDKVYNKGVEAYKGERWSECISQLEESLHLYKLYKTILSNCRLKCNSQPFESRIKVNIEDLRVYEKFFNIRNCIQSCQELAFADAHLKNEISDSILFDMQARKPYEYLQMCYFQMYMLPKAASATYTYLVVNPDDKSMQENLKYYIEQPEVDVNEIVDYDSEDYMVLYKLGRQSYTNNKWAETVASMEEVVTDYMAWENKCRVECERQPEQESSPEFVITISNNFASLLHCHQQCQEKLKSLGYDTGVEFMADILNYIQISYYHLGKITDAAKAVASYLDLIPDDEDMLENKKIYSSLVSEEAFSPRSDIIYYHQRDKYEKQLLNFFHRGDDSNIQSNNV